MTTVNQTSAFIYLDNRLYVKISVIVLYRPTNIY